MVAGVKAALTACLFALPVATMAQEAPPEATGPTVASGGAAVLRGLDKLSGDVRDIDLRVGDTVALGRLQVTLGDCRYPTGNPTGDAFAYLVIREAGVDDPAFAGWMIASSPGLSALEHPRYDVWVMRCNT